MAILSKETEMQIVEIVDRCFEKRLELEIRNLDEWDLIPRQKVCDKLEISTTTLDKWEKLGLKRYQSPFGRSKKIYYRKTDILNFMAVD